MRRGLLWPLFCGLLASLLSGCPEQPAGSKVKLVAGAGTVTYKGGPFPGATVVFVPEVGPPATGTTDLEGKFKLSSGTIPGVAVGKCSVIVTAVEGGGAGAPSGMMGGTFGTTPKTEEEGKRWMKAQEEALDKMKASAQGGTPASPTPPKSLIHRRS
jgi:hypothetical protein